MKDNLIYIPKKENIINLAPIKIEYNNNNYYLNISINNDIINFSINDKEKLLSINYIKTMNFKEIKDLNKGFSLFNSINDFYDYLKVLSENKKINIKKDEEKISIILNIEVLLKKEIIEINLYPGKIDLDLNIKNICNEIIYIKERIKDSDILKKENKELKEIQNKEINNLKEKEINELKEKIEIQNKVINNLKEKLNELNDKVNIQNKEINILKEKEVNKLKNEIKFLFENNKSAIINDDEINMIFSEIENRMNKKIIKIKKLYQATIDGGEPINFHSKCDNIENTLVLIKSEGLRRFGGFTPIPWESNGSHKKDQNLKTFIFSLDKKKIYSLKRGHWAVCHCKDSGPCFGSGRDIAIDKNPIKENTLYTSQYSYDYKGDKNSLSEFDGNKNIKALEYEVFQVIFL